MKDNRDYDKQQREGRRIVFIFFGIPAIIMFAFLFLMETEFGHEIQIAIWGEELSEGLITNIYQKDNLYLVVGYIYTRKKSNGNIEYHAKEKEIKLLSFPCEYTLKVGNINFQDLYLNNPEPIYRIQKSPEDNLYFVDTSSRIGAIQYRRIREQDFINKGINEDIEEMYNNFNKNMTDYTTECIKNTTLFNDSIIYGFYDDTLKYIKAYYYVEVSIQDQLLYPVNTINLYEELFYNKGKLQKVKAQNCISYTYSGDSISVGLIYKFNLDTAGNCIQNYKPIKLTGNNAELLLDSLNRYNETNWYCMPNCKNFDAKYLKIFKDHSKVISPVDSINQITQP